MKIECETQMKACLAPHQMSFLLFREPPPVIFPRTSVAQEIKGSMVTVKKWGLVQLSVSSRWSRG